MARSITKMKQIIQNKILEVSQTAAAFLDGDEIKSLTVADKNTEKYKKAYNTLALFKTNNIDDNAGMAFIYVLVKNDENKIVFSVDPSDDPAIFLEEEAVVTDAMLNAFNGKADFDNQSYQDRWGDLYSAYCPIFGADKTVKAVVGVDVWAKWYKSEITASTITIGIGSIISIAITALVTIFITRKLRKRLSTLNSDMSELQGSIKTLIKDINDNQHIENFDDKAKNNDTLLQLKEQINYAKIAIKNYIEYTHHQAFIDTLTGLGNRNAYFAAVEKIEHKIETDEYINLAVIVFDINGMKNINDIIGHEAGDKALILTGECLREIFGENISYRIGGDELVVIYQNVYEKTIQNKLDDFKKLVKEKNDKNNLEFMLSISSGYSFFNKNKDSKFQDIFNRADEEMYKEKLNYYKENNVIRQKNRKINN